MSARTDQISAVITGAGGNVRSVGFASALWCVDGSPPDQALLDQVQTGIEEITGAPVVNDVDPDNGRSLVRTSYPREAVPVDLGPFA